MAQTDSPPSHRHLSVFDAISVVVGIVVGAFIFKAPSLVAMFTGNSSAMLMTWVLGGLLCLCGALCYAELAGAYPKIGGEYVYLNRAYGRTVGFLFIWARVTVIQTGSIAAVAYVFGDYVCRMTGWAYPAPMYCALAATVALTGCNIVGLRAGTWTQNVLTAAKVLGVLAVIVAGLLVAPPAQAPAAASGPASAQAGSSWPGFDALSLAMVFVLYTFGGWNESAYVAGELRSNRRSVVWVLVGSVALITALYVGINLAFLRVLGIEGMASAQAVAADAMQRAVGTGGAAAVTVLVAVSALGALDGCIFTGSRGISALGGDYAVFRPLGRWHGRFKTPATAILLQSAVAVVLILLPGLGAGFRKALGEGFSTAVEYTAPAFWAFLLLTAVSVVVLRLRDPDTPRPFRVPLFPVTVGVFILMSGWMLYRSLDYRLGGAVVGVAVLLAGVPVYLLCLLWGRGKQAG